MAAAELALQRIFPGIVYNKSLIKREMLKTRKNKEGSRDSIREELVQRGHCCHARGGKFEFYFNKSAKDKAPTKPASKYFKMMPECKLPYSEASQSIEGW
eukprot:snap_masked-scaffold_1-processed-gene-19.56-mRNA-1 protein AED:1.00 eAED:1.00 QI:0/-1/0/0/-1/1/1/0/99